MLFVLFFTLIINAYATTPASVVVESGGSVIIKAGGTLEIGLSAVPVKSPPSPPPTQVSSTASPPPQVSSTASPPLTPPAAPTYKRLPNEAGNHGAMITCNSACCGQHNLCTTCASPAANDATTCQAGEFVNNVQAADLPTYAAKCNADDNCAAFMWDTWKRIFFLSSVAASATSSIITAAPTLTIAQLASETLPSSGMPHRVYLKVPSA